MTSTITEFTHLQIPLEDVRMATNNFADENIIGKGGFGNVYKGKLSRSGELISIAARRLDRNNGQGDVEFWTEISMLASIKHKHIASIIGFCDEEGEKIIINNHYAKGSLSMYVTDPTLSWYLRLQISVNVADAISYLHHKEGQSYSVIHRNINSFTILLDDNYTPVLSGFEFSIKHSIDRKNQALLTEAVGTTGYMDPAIEKTGGVTHKSDVYSFGVVLFEMLCGRKAYVPNEDNKFLARLAKFHYENRTLRDIIYPDISDQISQEAFDKFSETAYSCLGKERVQRPDMIMIYNQLHALITDVFWHRTSVLKQQDTHRLMTRRIKDDFMAKLQNVGLGDTTESTPFIRSKVNNLEHLRIELKDIQLATDNFSDAFLMDGYLVGCYKAQLECFDREYISSVEGKNKGELPKRIYSVKIKHSFVEEDMFYNEIEILSGCKHRNIESLLGFCHEGPQKIFVYEYVSLKYLSSVLERRILTWETRLKICLDIAQGLKYLHNDMEDQKMIIHRDINSEHVVLGDNGVAKIVGFGLSVFVHPNQDGNGLHFDDIEETHVYMDPEYVETRKLKRESDVYSFGVVMLDILCGKQANYLIMDEGRIDKDVAHLAKRWFAQGIIKKKILPILMEENEESNIFLNKGPNEDSLDIFVNVACQCLSEKQNQRPTMEIVIMDLERALSCQENHKDPLRMTFEKIKLATNNFSRDNDIGGGGFGRVYKGKFPHGHDNGHYTIVAKRLDKRFGQGDQQYYNELEILYKYKHENVIGLVGYSNEAHERIIVYEHASNGSLDNYLNDARLTWRKRLQICIDAASGLAFLHGGVDAQAVVIHRDIKTANILLFDDWKAKVADFGLSLISTIDEDIDYIIDHVSGTNGYVDPLYGKSGFLTIESDIYSFGVVLFEILCGRSTYEIYKHEGRYLHSYVKHYFEEGKQDEVVFQAIKIQIVPKSLTTFQTIAYKCLDDDRGKRPTANEVVKELKKALELQMIDQL